MWEQLRDPWTLGFGYAVPEFVDSEGLRYLRLYDVDERLTGHPGHKFGYQPAVGHSVDSRGLEADTADPVSRQPGAATTAS